MDKLNKEIKMKNTKTQITVRQAMKLGATTAKAFFVYDPPRNSPKNEKGSRNFAGLTGVSATLLISPVGFQIKAKCDKGCGERYEAFGELESRVGDTKGMKKELAEMKEMTCPNDEFEYVLTVEKAIKKGERGKRYYVYCRCWNDLKRRLR
jgi:hypothetical protein